MAKSKKTNKKTTTNKKGRTNNTKQIKNNNDLVFKIVTSIVVIGILCIVFNITYGGKRIVCTKTLTSDKASIQTSYTFRFTKDKLTVIKGNAILDYSKDDETSQEEFDKIVDRVNNKEKYEKVHVNKFNKKADINYVVKLEAADLGDDMTFDAIFNQVKNDESLGNCVVK